jgi:hypothetical protein
MSSSTLSIVKGNPKTFCGYTATELFNQSCTAEGLQEIITTIRNSNGVEWKLYGGRANQSNALKANTDAVTAFVELVTNTFDANGEFALDQNPMLAGQCETGFDIATAAHGMPGKFGTTPNGWRTKGGFEPQVTLYGEFDLNKATIDVADHGIGLDVDTVEKTILSLNDTNKFYNPLMFGMFGQGRAAMLHFSDASIVFTRTEDSDGLVVVVMRKLKTNDVDPDVNKKLPVDQWRYAVLSSTGKCPVLAVGNEDLTFGLRPELVRQVDPKTVAYYERCLKERGTIVRHTNFYVARHGALQRSGFGGGGSGLYQLLNEHIAGGPYLVDYDDLRTEKGKFDGTQGREVISGNIRKMMKKAGTPEMLYDSDWQAVEKYDTLRDEKNHSSKLKYRIFIVEDPEENHRTAEQNQSGRVGMWVSRHNSGGIFFNGQLHDRVSSSDIRKAIPYLAGQTLIFFDGDDLANEIKNEMLGSSREHIDGEHFRKIHEDILIPLLKTDPNIQALHEKQRQAAKGNKDATDQQIIDEVNRLFNVKPRTPVKNTTGKGPRSGGSNGGGRGGTLVEKQVPLTTVISQQYLNITLNQKTVQVGSTFMVPIETNIPGDRLYPDTPYCTIDAPDFLVPVHSNGGAESTHYTVSGPDGDYGPTRLYFKVKPTATIGDEADLKIKIYDRQGKTLAAQDLITLTVVPKKVRTGSGFYLEDVVIVERGDESWRSLGFTDNMFARLVESEGAVTLYLSQEHELLRATEQAIMHDGRSGDRHDIYLDYFFTRYLKKHASIAALGALNHFGDLFADMTTNDEVSTLDKAMLSSLEGYINLYLRTKADIVPATYQVSA